MTIRDYKNFCLCFRQGIVSRESLGTDTLQGLDVAGRHPFLHLQEGQGLLCHDPMLLRIQESLHDGILVSGRVDATAEGECVRCLIDVALPIEVEFQELFAYSFDEAFDYTVHDDYVDLEPVVRDAVVLSLPFQPVCQEDCLGLCPQCGVRLLDNPGHEHEAPVDPRWAALAGLDGLNDDTESDKTEKR